MITLYFHCMYCGHNWKNSYWSTPSSSICCPICNEKKSIKVKRKEAGDGDIFGYDDKETKDAYIKKGDE